AGVAAVTRTRRPPLGRSLLRLFTVQGSWNYERLQGIGVGVAEEPLLRDLRAAGNGAVYRAAVARGAHFFNAHPYLCGLAVGAAARAEHEGATPDQIERLRSALCGPLGSLGDRLVWAGWLPVTSGLALIGVALGLGMDAACGSARRPSAARFYCGGGGGSPGCATAWPCSPSPRWQDGYGGDRTRSQDRESAGDARAPRGRVRQGGEPLQIGGPSAQGRPR